VVKPPIRRKPTSGRQWSTTMNEEDVKRFSKSAKTYTGKVTASQQSARRAMVDLGISTETGKLTKRYR
jgi:hypothetical protein